MELRKTLIASLDALFVRFAFFETTSIRSFLVTDIFNHHQSFFRPWKYNREKSRMDNKILNY